MGDIIRVTGTLINYYFHCKRQCYLFGNNINMEDNSELVKIGKAMHERRQVKGKSELVVDNVKIDKIDGEYLIEYKKSNSDINACRWQLLYYLKILKSKGINKKGKLICFEKKSKESKILEVMLTKELENELTLIENKINNLIGEDKVPGLIKKSNCKKCSYYSYCYI